MSDQASFGDFTGDGDDDRPPEEAAAVAGNGGASANAAVVTDDSRYPAADGTLRMAVTQVDYTVEGRGDEEYPVVHAFGRTPDGTREHVRVLEFEPYFYTPTDELTEDPVEAYGSVLSARETGPDGEPFESIRGERLTKIVARTPRDVGSIRDDFETTYEADILFPNRFLIDKGVGGGVEVPARRLDDGRLQVHHTEVEPVEVEADLRVNTFDIEVDDRNGFPEDGEEPIVCLTSHDSYADEYVLWVWEPEAATASPPADLDGYEQIDGSADVEVRVFDTETAMLDDFLSYLKATDPDVITGWNFEDFDAPYLLDRLEVLAPEAAEDESLAVERLSRVDEVWRGGWGGPDIKGRVVFDLLYAYKRTQFTELESYRLDAVAELELDVGKERYSGDIGDLWEQEPDRLLEYNLRDVELCVEIDRKQSVIAFWDEVRRFVGCLLEDAPTPGDAVDVYVLHNAHGRFALPTKGQQASEEFEGGAVFEPVTGVRENVTVLDL
ncbi:MAG: 3'-5' exonuclease, partial [Haloferacaceae archaeon]